MMTGGHATQQILEHNLLERETQTETLAALQDPLGKEVHGELPIVIVHVLPRCDLVLGRDVRNFGLDFLPSAVPLPHPLHDIAEHIARLLRAQDIQRVSSHGQTSSQIDVLKTIGNIA